MHGRKNIKYLLLNAVLNFHNMRNLASCLQNKLKFLQEISTAIYPQISNFSSWHARPSNQKTVLWQPSTTACEMFALSIHIRRPYPVHVRPWGGDKTQVCNTTVHTYTCTQNFSVCVDISLWFGWRWWNYVIKIEVKTNRLPFLKWHLHHRYWNQIQISCVIQRNAFEMPVSTFKFAAASHSEFWHCFQFTPNSRELWCFVRQFHVCCRHVLDFTRLCDIIISSRTCKMMMSNKTHALNDAFHW